MVPSERGKVMDISRNPGNFCIAVEKRTSVRMVSVDWNSLFRFFKLSLLITHLDKVLSDKLWLIKL